MNNGWIKIHRDILSWEWWEDHNTTRFFIYLLLKANHEDKKWQGVMINQGQLICSLTSLSKGCGLSVQQIRTAISKLVQTGEITKKSTNRYMVLTVVNYSKYQEVPTNEQQTNNKRATTTKELKELKNNNTPLTPQGESEGKAKKPKYFLTQPECFDFINKIVAAQEIREVAHEWVRMRYAKSKGEHRLTERAIKNAFKKLSGLGYSQTQVIASLEQSIEGLWDNLYAVKS